MIIFKLINVFEGGINKMKTMHIGFPNETTSESSIWDGS